MKINRFLLMTILTSSLLLAGCNKKDNNSNGNNDSSTPDSKDTTSTDGHEHRWDVAFNEWTGDYSECTATRVCTLDRTHIETETVSSIYEVLTPETLDEDGLARYTANFTNTSFATQIQEVVLPKDVYATKPHLFEGEYYDTIKYGLYPQKHVKDTDLISQLNSLSTPEANGWYLYDGVYYAKTVAKPYDNYYFDDGIGIQRGKTYWFKCEPITWKVLSNDLGECLILTLALLDVHTYCDTTTNREIDGQTIYPNNYMYSDVRSWLVNGFYHSAFALGNKHIQTTTLDNRNTGDQVSQYGCADTEDKVFLLSYQDYCSTRYFHSRTEYKAVATDWAKAKGAYLWNTSYSYGYYWTRSPHASFSDRVCNVGVEGTVVGSTELNNVHAYYNDCCVRAAITINLD